MEYAFNMFNPLRSPTANTVIQAGGFVVLTRLVIPEADPGDLASMGVLFVASQVLPPFDSPLVTAAVVGVGVFYLTRLDHVLALSAAAGGIIFASNFVKKVRAEEAR